MNERRTTNNEQRTTNDERRTRRRRITKEKWRTTNARRTNADQTMERSKGYVSRPKKKTRKEELWRTKTETECSTQKYFKLNPTYPIQERKSSFSSWQIGTVNKSRHEGICKLIKRIPWTFYSFLLFHWLASLGCQIKTVSFPNQFT